MVLLAVPVVEAPGWARCQRITGSQLSPRLQYFGQSLSGGQDLTMDGLMDLAVGAQGHLLLLRSQPLLRVEATMDFTPSEVARNVFECQEQEVRNKIAGVVRVCLHVRKRTRDRLREGDVQSVISYVLALDSGRPSSRAIFDETKNSTHRRKQALGLTTTCETLTLLLPKCVDDSVSPIVLRLNYTLVGTPVSSFGNLRPVLAEDSQKFFTASFPFEKNCGNDNICQDDLSVTFSFRNLRTLVVGDPRELNVTLTVRNEGEDSYGTQVTLYHPAGLSYRKVSVVQVTFNVTFDVEFDASLGNKLLLKANVTSENNIPRTNKTEFQLELPVKYAVYLIVSSGETSTKYLNFTASEKTSQAVEHQYQVGSEGSGN
ncbi:Integrin alpha-M [Fukomys damarensis]|uniref:Integrin alpha-M n=1 Tax=Fukomys damarensis TaxID=885580 RepID=A0A091D4M0_FUKDA|nr:Integrin alpha-M [Fukomys damarensis]